MRVFPLLDLQVAEFANQKARPGAGLHVQICAAADASPSTPPTRPSRRSATSACSSSRSTTPCAPTSVATWRFRSTTSKSTRAPLWEGMNDLETV